VTTLNRTEELLREAYGKTTAWTAMDERILNKATTVMKQVFATQQSANSVSVWRRIIRHFITKVVMALTLGVGLIWVSWQSFGGIPMR